MTNYSKTTNFTAKDSLVSGDANKIVKGSEIDAEFDNIATASATKANIASPAFTGVVSFPDGTAGDPSITNTGDTNTGLFFSAADTLAFSSAGTAQFTMSDGAIAPVTDNDVDLGTSSLEFKDGYFDGTVHTDAINLNGTAITSTAAEINILDGVTATAAELNILDGVTSTAAELNILDGVTSTAAELNILDGVTATTAELNYNDTGSAVGTVVASKVVTVDANKDVASFRNITLTGELDAGSLDISGDADIDGTLETDALSINGTAVTSTAAELNILDGVTSTAAELNILDGVTSTAAELNILDGVTATTAELNIMDGVTATTAELNIMDGVTASAADINLIDGITNGTVIASKAIITDSNKDITGGRNITISGELDAATLDISGDADIDGTLETDALSINGTAVTSTAAELNILDGVTSTAAELNILDGVTSTAAELNILDGVTSTAAELNILDGVTAVAGELNALDLGSTAVGIAIASKAVVLDSNKDFTGVRNFSITGDLSVAGTTTVVDSVQMTANNAVIFEGATADASETTLTSVDATADRTISLPDQSGTLPVLAAVSTTAITSTPEELNVLDGITAVVGELNALDLGSTAVGTAIASKAVILDSNKDYTGIRNFTISGELDAGSLDISGDIDVDGTTNLDVVDIDGALTQDGGAVFNEASADVDFRVESNAQTHMLFVDGGNNLVSVTPNSATLSIRAGSDDATNNVRLEASGTTSTFLEYRGFLGHIFDVDTTATFKIGVNEVSTPTAGTSNVRFGVNAGNSIASGGNYNVVVGDEAGTALTTGDENVAIGYNALAAEDGNGKNVAVGKGSLNVLNAGADGFNTAVGHSAGGSLTSGIRNTLIGGEAGKALTDADFNVAVGFQALLSDQEGSRSVAVGYNALVLQNKGSAFEMANVAIGMQAGENITTGYQNTAVGNEALNSDDTGRASVAVGFQALKTQNMDADEEAQNVAVGYQTSYHNVIGRGNTTVGFKAGAGASGNSHSNLVAIGAKAGQDITTGDRNTFVGASAGENVNSGSYNTLVGGLAGDSLTTADYTTVIGGNALVTEDVGNTTTAVGYAAGYSQNTATASTTFNTLLGFQTGFYNVTGTGNTYVGHAVGQGASGQSNNSNTGMGREALFQITTGSTNTALGYSAGISLTSGDNNLLLGADAGRSGSPGGNLTTHSNNVVLGDENISAFYAQVALTVSSDERDKTDFVDLDLGLDFVKALEPVTYYWDKRSKYGDKDADDYDLDNLTPDGTHKEDWMDVGFKAQAVQTLQNASGYTSAANKNLLVGSSDDGKQLGLKYEKFIPILVKAIQDQDEIIQSLTARIAALES